MPASQVIKARLAMSVVPKPKPMTKPQPVKAAATVQKAKPAQVQKQKPVTKKVASVIPEPEPKPQAKPLPVPRSEPEPEPEPELEPVQAAVETQPPLAIATVAEPIEALQPRQAAIAEAPYVPPSSNVAYYHNPKPRYPMAAKQCGMEGVIELRVIESRMDAYKSLFKAHIDEVEINEIRAGWQTGTPLGNDCFKKKIEKKLNSKVGRARRGRPKRALPLNALMPP